jgi:hypothetical protein
MEISAQSRISCACGQANFPWGKFVFPTRAVSCTSAKTHCNQSLVMSEATESSAAGAFKNLKLNPEQIDSGADFLKEIAPDAGILAGGATKGATGIATALALIFYRHMTEDLAEQGKEWDKLAEILAKPMGATASDYDKHANDARQAVANFQASIAHAGTDPDPIGTKFRLIKIFSVTFIEGVKNELESQGGLEEAKLLSQNATSQQIVAAREQRRAKIGSLNELEGFFNGSGLLMLEQTARQNIQPQLNAGSTTAILAQQKATAANEDQQKEIQNLKNATGRGDLGPKDPVYLFYQTKLEETQKN